jgi:hypothetical protein
MSLARQPWKDSSPGGLEAWAYHVMAPGRTVLALGDCCIKDFGPAIFQISSFSSQICVQRSWRALWALSVDFCDSSAIYGNFVCNGASPVDRSHRKCGVYLVALRELGMLSGRYIPSRSRARRALRVGKNHSCLQTRRTNGGWRSQCHSILHIINTSSAAPDDIRRMVLLCQPSRQRYADEPLVNSSLMTLSHL